MPPQNYPFRTEPSRISQRLAPNLDREAQAARTGVLRVGIRDLELAAEQVFLPLELRPLEVRRLFGSTNTFTSCSATTMSVGRAASARSIRYCIPLQPPAMIRRRSEAAGCFSFCRNTRMRRTALSVTVSGSCWGAIKRIASRPVRTRAVVLSLPPRIARSARGARHSPHVRPKIYITTL